MLAFGCAWDVRLFVGGYVWDEWGRKTHPRLVLSMTDWDLELGVFLRGDFFGLGIIEE